MCNFVLRVYLANGFQKSMCKRKIEHRWKIRSRFLSYWCSLDGLGGLVQWVYYAFFSLWLMVTEIYLTLDIYRVNFCLESTKVNLQFPDTGLYMESTTNSSAFAIQRLHHPAEQVFLYVVYVFFVYELSAELTEFIFLLPSTDIIPSSVFLLVFSSLQNINL